MFQLAWTDLYNYITQYSAITLPRWHMYKIQHFLHMSSLPILKFRCSWLQRRLAFRGTMQKSRDLVIQLISAFLPIPLIFAYAHFFWKYALFWLTLRWIMAVYFIQKLQHVAPISRQPGFYLFCWHFFVAKMTPHG